MPVRIANTSITLVRDGKALYIEPGQGVELTKEEIETFKEIKADAFRTPENKVIQVVSLDSHGNTITNTQGEASFADTQTGSDAQTEAVSTETEVDGSGKSTRGRNGSKGGKADDSDDAEL